MQDSLKEKLEIVYICITSEISVTHIPPVEYQKKVFAFLNSKPVGISSTTFRPPADIL